MALPPSTVIDLFALVSTLCVAIKPVPKVPALVVPTAVPVEATASEKEVVSARLVPSALVICKVPNATVPTWV